MPAMFYQLSYSTDKHHCRIYKRKHSTLNKQGKFVAWCQRVSTFQAPK